MSGNDPSCPLLAKALAIANAIISGGGACQKWFDNHGVPKCGPFSVSVLSDKNPLCYFNHSYHPGAAGAIFICHSTSAKGANLTNLVSLLIHEYAHAWCIPLPIISEGPCAVQAQYDCLPEISDKTLCINARPELSMFSSQRRIA
jgi:hypothetical protein